MLAVFIGTDLLWRNALIAVPVAVLVAAVCRCLPARPATRHLLWLVVLVVLFAPPALPTLRLPPAGNRTVVPSVSAVERKVSPLTTERLTHPASTASDHGSLRESPKTSAASPRQARTQHRSDMRSEQVTLGSQSSTLAKPSSGIVQSAPLAFDPIPSRSQPEVAVDTRAAVPSPALAPSASPSLSEMSVTGAAPAKISAQPAPVSSNGNLPPSKTQPTPHSAFSIPWSLWADRLRAVLNAVASLPSFPPMLWLAGSLALALIAAIRLMQHRRLFSGSSPASPRVTLEVRNAAERMGLSRAPHTVMVRGRVSPMIWCGRRPVLVLPLELWEELDEVGRLAVIHHELAHLKRRDHWVCWAELFATAVYWWNPLVWWVRRRIREEADLCCDAWVTALFPQGRRAYAQALLNTRRFISESPSARPDVGLGAISSGARHFARRLTMVMTHRPAPSRSLPGILLAATLAAAGFLAAPLVACPPEDGKEQAAKERARNTLTIAGQAAAMAPVPAQAAQPAAAPRAAQAPRAPRPPKAPRSYSTTPAPAAVATPSEPSAGGMWRTDVSPEAASTIEERARSRQRAASAPQPTMPRQAGPAGESMTGQASRNSEGLRQMEQRINQMDRRLEDMNRRLDQVLRQLERHGAGNPVQAGQALAGMNLSTPLMATIAGASAEEGQRAIIVLIGPDDKVEAYKLGQGQMGALTALLTESGNPLAAQIYSDPLLAERALVARNLDIARMHADAARLAGEARSEAIAANRDALSKHRAALAELQRHADSHRQAADKLREKAEQLAERAESMQDRICELLEKAESSEGAERDASLKQVEALKANIEALQSAAERLQEQAEELADHAGNLSDEASEMIDESANDDSSDEDEQAAAEATPAIPAIEVPEPAEPSDLPPPAPAAIPS